MYIRNIQNFHRLSPPLRRQGVGCPVGAWTLTENFRRIIAFGRVVDEHEDWKHVSLWPSAALAACWNPWRERFCRVDPGWWISEERSAVKALWEILCWNMKRSEERERTELKVISRDQLVALAGPGYKARLCASKMLDSMEERTSWNRERYAMWDGDSAQDAKLKRRTEMSWELWTAPKDRPTRWPLSGLKDVYHCLPPSPIRGLSTPGYFSWQVTNMCFSYMGRRYSRYVFALMIFPMRVACIMPHLFPEQVIDFHVQFRHCSCCRGHPADYILYHLVGHWPRSTQSQWVEIQLCQGQCSVLCSAWQNAEEYLQRSWAACHRCHEVKPWWSCKEFPGDSDRFNTRIQMNPSLNVAMTFHN